MSLFGLCMHERFISIHAAREGGDELGLAYDFDEEISIHAAREGGDTFMCIVGINPPYFNPRRP